MLQIRYSNSSKPPIWLVAPRYTIGTDSDCDCIVSGDGIAPVHAELIVDDEKLTVSKLEPAYALSINGVSLVDQSAELKHGDSLTIGGAELEIFDPKLLRNDSDWFSSEEENHIEWSLQALNSALGNRRFPVEGQVLLGRSKDCDISLAVSHLSRKHARLSVSPKGLLVEDLQSSNGTFVNGKRVQQAYLKPGDELGFDNLKFRIVCSEDDEEKTSVRPVVNEADIKNTMAKSQKKSFSQRKNASVVKPQLPRSVRNTARGESRNTNPIQLVIGVAFMLVAAAGLVWFFLL